IAEHSWQTVATRLPRTSVARFRALDAVVSLRTDYMLSLLFSDRPNAALGIARQLAAIHEEAARLWTDRSLSPPMSEVYSELGRGLAGIGQLQAGRELLKQSLAIQSNRSALEYLGILAHKDDRPGDAV